MMTPRIGNEPPISVHFLGGMSFDNNIYFRHLEFFNLTKQIILNYMTSEQLKDLKARVTALRRYL